MDILSQEISDNVDGLKTTREESGISFRFPRNQKSHDFIKKFLSNSKNWRYSCSDEDNKMGQIITILHYNKIRKRPICFLIFLFIVLVFIMLGYWYWYFVSYQTSDNNNNSEWEK